MFNIGKFNQLPFNGNSSTQPTPSIVWQGTAYGVGTATAKFKRKMYFKASADAVANTVSELGIEFSLSAVANAATTSDGWQIRVRWMDGFADAVGEATASILAYGQQSINLSGLSLAEGDLLIIDTENMTITLNGNNAMQYLTDDSVFFEIEKGDKVSIEGDGSATVTMLWKDRWV